MIIKYSWPFNLSADFLLRILLIADIFFMTRGYAVSNILEHLLFILVLSRKEFREDLIYFAKDPLGISIIGFFCWQIISIFWSQSELMHSINTLWGWRKILLIPVVWIAFRRQGDIRLIYISLLICSFIFCAISYFMYLFNINEFWERSAWSILQNHSIQGVLFSFSSYMLFIFSKEAFKKNSKAPIFTIALGFLFLFNLILVGSGFSGYICIIGFTLCYTILSSSCCRLLIAAATFILSAVWWFFSPEHSVSIGLSRLDLITKMSSYFELAQLDSSLVRLMFWKNTLLVIGGDPFLGVGIGSFEAAYESVMRSQGGEINGLVTDNPHQQYLHITAEFGLIGLLLFFMFLWRIHLLINWGSLDGQIVGGLFVMLLLLGLINGSFSDIILSRVLYILVGILFYAQHLEKQKVNR